MTCLCSGRAMTQFCSPDGCWLEELLTRQAPTFRWPVTYAIIWSLSVVLRIVAKRCKIDSIMVCRTQLGMWVQFINWYQFRISYPNPNSSDVLVELETTIWHWKYGQTQTATEYSLTSLRPSFCLNDAQVTNHPDFKWVSGYPLQK